MSKVPRHVVASALARRTLGSFDAEALSRELAAYLLDTQRTGELDSLLRDIQAYRAEHGIVEVAALSAHELTPSVRRDIEAQVRELYPAAKEVIISEVHDPTIVGGVKLELPGRQLDLSVRGKLNRLKQLTAAGKE